MRGDFGVYLLLWRRGTARAVDEESEVCICIKQKGAQNEKLIHAFKSCNDRVIGAFGVDLRILLSVPI